MGGVGSLLFVGIEFEHQWQVIADTAVVYLPHIRPVWFITSAVVWFEHPGVVEDVTPSDVGQ